MLEASRCAGTWGKGRVRASVLALGSRIKLGFVGAAVERKLLREKLGDLRTLSRVANLRGQLISRGFAQERCESSAPGTVAPWELN